ncbi:hypothetical protein KO317_04320 [Candidatus Micrarchaeota archaeon]|nr:hypothetical protein [Candidatus Micrarchaeota archaeon]
MAKIYTDILENPDFKKFKSDIVKGHPLFEKVRDNLRMTCALFKVEYDPIEMKIKDNIISGYDATKKEIVSFIHEKDKTILMVYDAPKGKPIKLVDIKYAVV